LPHLQALWPQLGETARDVGDEMSLSAPHERALARALGIPVADGLLPIAAIDAARAGFDTAGRAWARLTPAHWQLGAERISMSDPAALALDDSASRAFLDAVRELFESEGFALRYQAPSCWLVAHESLATLPTASLDRVIGRNIDAWLAADPRARLVRRLQNEVQMLLHTHPLNAAREARGELPVNSVWLSGSGLAPAVRWPPALQVDDRLRAPALNEDWLAWAKAWQALDAGPLVEALARTKRGEPLALTLCGERTALSLAPQPRGLFRRLATVWRQPDVTGALEAL
jgi:hypothetical protein